MYKRVVIRAGNSLAVTIPARVAKNMDIKEGDIAIMKIVRSRAKIAYLFEGHPKQLSLIKK